MKNRFLIAAAALAACCAPVRSAATPWQSNAHGQVRMLVDLEQAPRNGALLIGFEFQPVPHWHVYWKNPGDAGYPPKVAWEGSKGAGRFQWLWPVPHRYDLPGNLIAIGYEHDVIYPVRARVQNAGQTVHLHAELSYLTCNDSCVPYKYDFTLDLPAGDHAMWDGNTSPALERALLQVPAPMKDFPAINVTAAYTRAAAGGIITVEAVGPALGAADQTDIFFERDDAVSFGKPTSRAIDGGVQWTTPVSSLAGGDVPRSLHVDFVVRHAPFSDGSIAFEDERHLMLTGSSAPAAPVSEPVAPAAPLSLGWALLLAFLGGVILNVMPCVLPVLSIKLLGLLQHAGRSRGVIVADALASVAGILFSFLVLAGAVIAAKAAGHAVGWGIQFQEPIFVGALAIVVLLFALNLWGVFEIELPLVFTRAGLARPGDEGLASYFTSGLFATLLATPCSAPFLGTAMGFALAQSAGVILLIFIAVGLGLAAPYIVLALAPQMIGFLPKPGAWMLRVRTAMGFLLAAAVVWLVYVLASQVTPRGAALFTIALLLLAGVLVGREAFVRNGRYGGLQKAMTWIAGALIIVGGLSALRWSARTEEVSATTARGGARWQPFSEAALARATAEGQTVFLDITADWCFTCKFNEARVLSDADVLQAFRDHHIVLMRGDWTNHNAEIGHFLMTMGRAGIPFNALYRPGRPPVLFSELLNKKKILKNL